jgi:hypothetical protein
LEHTVYKNIFFPDILIFTAQSFSSTLSATLAFQFLSSFQQIPLTAYLGKEHFSLLGDVNMGYSILERTAWRGVEGYDFFVRG